MKFISCLTNCFILVFLENLKLQNYKKINYFYQLKFPQQKILVFERRKLVFERKKLVFERRKLVFERKKLVFERRKLFLFTVFLFYFKYVTKCLKMRTRI